MPGVDNEPGQFEGALQIARQLSAAQLPFPDGSLRRCVAVITPGRLVVPLACPAPGSCGPEMTEGLCAMIGQEAPRQIVAIAFTDVVGQDALDPLAMNEMIPFLGLLVGLAYLGHNVVVFEGHPFALSAGCRDVDLVLVDEEMVPYLQPDWQKVVDAVMWRPNVRIAHYNTDGISFMPPRSFYDGI